MITDMKEYHKQWYLKNKDRYKEYQKLHGSEMKEYQKEWNSKNENYQKTYQKLRRKKDPLFKLASNTRNLIKNRLKYNFTNQRMRTNDILGCSFEQFKSHLESKFDDKMNWDNHGTYWEIDHIKPISMATTEQEIIELNHYTNLQPLEKTENRKKSSSYY